MNAQPAFLNPEIETRKFFWFMTAVLGGMAVMAAAGTEALRQPLPLAAFALLMIVHIGLHWRVAWFAARPGGMKAYLAVQGLLSAGLVLLSGHLGLAFALAMALVGEVIGVYGVTRKGMLAGVYFLALALGTYAWVSGEAPIGWGTLALVPMVVFVVIYVELYNRQASANVRAQELLAELEAANRQLSEYAAQVEDLTIAAERQRMARELHDTLSQGLAGLVLQLEAADAHLAAGRAERARQIVGQAMEGARTALGGARRAIDELRSPRAADASFEAALRAEVERFRAATGVEVSYSSGFKPQMDADGRRWDDRDDEDMGARHALTGDWRGAEALLRIAAEALNNIARHARASKVGVRIDYLEHAVQLEIQDDGCGFDPAAIPAGHYGLLGMQERARLAGGRLEIDSRPGAGTTVRAKVALP